MKVLILSITAGQGHHTTGKAIMDEVKARGHECEMIDTFKYINPILSESVAKGYLMSTIMTPAVYGNLYRLAEKKDKNDSKYSIAKLTNSILALKLESFIEKYAPDYIICTHIFSAQVMTQLKKHITTTSIGIITDFTIHPFWEDTDLDYYVTANERLSLQAKKKEIPVEKLLPFGIPINEKFTHTHAKDKAREQLGICEKNTIFVMSGSMGYGNVTKIIKQLDKMDLDFQIVSVCGNNKSLKRKIDKMVMQKPIKNYGYADNVDVIMDAADCIITKPGGLTVSESLAKGLPLLLINPIPGQEERNVEFLLNNGLAMRIRSTFPVDEAIFHLFYDDSRLDILSGWIKKFGRPEATKDLVAFMISHLKVKSREVKW